MLEDKFDAIFVAIYELLMESETDDGDDVTVAISPHGDGKNFLRVIHVDQQIRMAAVMFKQQFSTMVEMLEAMNEGGADVHNTDESP